MSLPGRWPTRRSTSLEAVAYDRPVMATAEQARQVMEVYMAADLSAESNLPVSLPLAAPGLQLAASG